MKPESRVRYRPAERLPPAAFALYKEVSAHGIHPESPAPVKQSSLRRVVTASMAGTVVEWYEFFLYATAATLVFNKIMFPPSDDPYAPIIAA